MTIKTILIFSALFIGTIGNNTLATKTTTHNIKRFDKGWDTDLNNNTSCDLFMSVMLNNCPENNNVKIVRILTHGTKCLEGTVGSFNDTYKTDSWFREINLARIEDFWKTVKENNALFDVETQTIFYGNEVQINNHYNKVQALEKKLSSLKKKLQFNEKFVEQSCKEEYQCKNLKKEIEETKKEISKLYQNL